MQVTLSPAPKLLARHRAKGLTLLEALVALIILSIGLVGIASLHLLAQRSAHASLQTANASVIALDLEEWLWEALAEPGLENCPDFAATVKALEAHWQQAEPNAPDNNSAWPTASRLQLPNLEIELLSTNDEGEWITGTIAVRWEENRLIDSTGTEELQFTARVACPPDDTAGS